MTSASEDTLAFKNDIPKRATNLQGPCISLHLTGKLNSGNSNVLEVES